MSQTNLVYNVEDKPAWGKTMIFALQQLLAILAATIAVPAIIGHGMSASAALFGAGAGTLVYLLFTKFKSPVLIVCNGHGKARALQHAIECAVSQEWTISALQMHPHAIIVCDEAATDELKHGTYKYFKDIEKDNL